LAALTIASLVYPLIPDKVLSTYELPIEEIVSSSPDRLIVYEGSEERLNQVTVGLLEQVGIGRAPWEKDSAFQPPPLVRPENQLPAATRVPMQAPPMRRPDPDSVEETWDEDNWERQPERVEVRPPQQRQQQARQMSVRDDDWDNAIDHDQYGEQFDDADDVADVEYAELVEPVAEAPAPMNVPVSDAPAAAPTPEKGEDPWSSPPEADATPQPPSDYQPQAFTIAEKQKQPEFEES
jgi:hypothetical protein